MMTNENAAKTASSGTVRVWTTLFTRFNATYQNGAEAAYRLAHVEGLKYPSGICIVTLLSLACYHSVSLSYRQAYGRVNPHRHCNGFRTAGAFRSLYPEAGIHEPLRGLSRSGERPVDQRRGGGSGSKCRGQHHPDIRSPFAPASRQTNQAAARSSQPGDRHHACTSGS